MGADEEIAKLAAQRDSGGLTEEQFESAKSIILGVPRVPSTASRPTKSRSSTKFKVQTKDNGRTGPLVAAAALVILCSGVGLWLGGVIGTSTPVLESAPVHSQLAVASCNADARSLEIMVLAFDQNSHLPPITREAGGTGPGEIDVSSRAAFARTASRGRQIQRLLSGPRPWLQQWILHPSYAVSLAYSDPFHGIGRVGNAGEAIVWVQGSPNPVVWDFQTSLNGCNTL